MVLTSPLSLANAYDLLRVGSVEWDNPGSQQYSVIASGEILVADLAPRLWSGVCNLVPRDNDDASAIMALLSWLRGPGRAFFLANPAKPGPRDDRDGTILDTNTPTILSLNADNKRLALDGLPVGYTLRRGDFLSFTYDSSPTRYAMHRIVETLVTADGSGETSEFEVEPNIRANAASSTSVVLVKPFIKAKIIPKSVSPGTADRALTGGISFKFMQTLG